MLDTISIFLNLLRFDLWPKMWSILENVPCALEKKVYSFAFGWKILKISMRSVSSNVSFKTCFSLVTLFCWSVHWCEWGVRVCYYCVTINFSFYVRQCLSHVLRCSYVGCISSVQFSCSVVSDSLWPHGLHHARLPCPSPTPRVYSNSCPLSRWCHPTVSSSVVPFSSRLQSFPTSDLHIRWPKYWISASTSVLPVNIQDWFPL